VRFLEEMYQYMLKVNERKKERERDSRIYVCVCVLNNKRLRKLKKEKLDGVELRSRNRISAKAKDFEIAPRKSSFARFLFFFHV